MTDRVPFQSARNLELLARHRPAWMDEFEKRILIAMGTVPDPQMVNYIGDTLSTCKPLVDLLTRFDLVMILTRPDEFQRETNKAREEEEKLWQHEEGGR